MLLFLFDAVLVSHMLAMMTTSIRQDVERNTVPSKVKEEEETEFIHANFTCVIRVQVHGI